MNIASEDVRRLLGDINGHEFMDEFDLRVAINNINGRLNAWLEICLEEESNNDRRLCKNGVLGDKLTTKS